MQASKLSNTTKLIGEAFHKAIDAALLDASALEWQLTLGESSPVETPDLSGSAAFRCSFRGASSGDVIIGVHDDLLPRFGFREVEANAPDATNLHKDKLLRALQGTQSQLEEALSKSGVVTIQVELVNHPTLADYEVLELGCRPKSESDDSTFSVFLCISGKVIEDFRPVMEEPFVFPHAKETSAGNLDLVMDVELNVTLRFGQRQLALREVLELSSGSVVELDRQVDEPIELIIDGKVVARGEAVIIDGNYGMRVTQVLQPIAG